MDPLSDVLSLLKLRSYLCGGFDVGGELSLQFPQHEGIKCYAVVSGQCWLSVEGVPDAVHLKVAIASCCRVGAFPPCERSEFDACRRPHDFCDRTEWWHRLVQWWWDCFIVGGHFALTGNHASILLGVLPPIVHIRKESDKAAMRWSLERMRQELREPQPGGFLVAQHLARDWPTRSPETRFLLRRIYAHGPRKDRRDLGLEREEDRRQNV
jgi:hypothetical protein